METAENWPQPLRATADSFSLAHLPPTTALTSWLTQPVNRTLISLPTCPISWTVNLLSSYSGVSSWASRESSITFREMKRSSKPQSGERGFWRESTRTLSCLNHHFLRRSSWLPQSPWLYWRWSSSFTSVTFPPNCTYISQRYCLWWLYSFKTSSALSFQLAIWPERIAKGKLSWRDLVTELLSTYSSALW